MKTTLFAYLFITVATTSAQNAEQLYQKHCSHCHGVRFQGSNAQSLVDGVWQFGDKKSHISRNIKNGITQIGMPAYKGTLSDREINALTTYLLEAGRKAGAQKPPIPKSLQTLDYNIAVEKWIEGLETPWSIASLDDKTALVTERPGRLRIVEDGRLFSKPVEGIPEVVAEGQGGLLDVAFDPNYKDEGNQWIYLSFSHGLDPEPNGRRAPAMTKIVRGRIDGNRWTDEQTVFEAAHEDYRTTRHHYGTRMVFDSKGNLYFSIGERGHAADAQNLSKPNGKIHRLRPDGSIPKDNPFRHIREAMPSIFSYGHRNPQGMTVHPETGQIWASEHGPMGGDELNLIEAGKNYGWPVITYGKNYNGSIISDMVRKDGMEQPVWYWRPSTAVCGIDFYHGNLFPKWNNRLLVGALKYEDVRVLNIEKNRVMHEEVILKNAGRVRDVVCGPDGAIYIVLNDPGTILRLTPTKD